MKIKIMIEVMRFRIPRLTLPAKICAKRVEYIRHLHVNDYGEGSAKYSKCKITRYHMTFGIGPFRKEMIIPRQEYEMRKPGTKGKLSFAGRRFLKFDSAEV